MLSLIQSLEKSKPTPQCDTCHPLGQQWLKKRKKKNRTIRNSVKDWNSQVATKNVKFSHNQKV